MSSVSSSGGYLRTRASSSLGMLIWKLRLWAEGVSGHISSYIIIYLYMHIMFKWFAYLHSWDLATHFLSEAASKAFIPFCSLRKPAQPWETLCAAEACEASGARIHQLHQTCLADLKAYIGSRKNVFEKVQRWNTNISTIRTYTILYITKQSSNFSKCQCIQKYMDTLRERHYDSKSSTFETGETRQNRQKIQAHLVFHQTVLSVA